MEKKLGHPSTMIFLQFDANFSRQKEMNGVVGGKCDYRGKSVGIISRAREISGIDNINGYQHDRDG
jgi:hypothetical protein